MIAEKEEEEENGEKKRKEKWRGDWDKRRKD